MTRIQENVKAQFGITSFVNDLRDSIGTMYTIFLKDKLSISINDIKVKEYPLNIHVSDTFKPSKIIDSFEGVNIEITCYIKPRTSRSDSLDRRGWNVFCNDRLILKEDTSVITGWRDDSKDKEKLPKYHEIYNEFRGIVRISSNDPSKLPLNTTKTSLILEHPVYRYSLNLMIKTAKPIIKFLGSKYKKEVDGLDDIEKTSSEAEPKAESEINVKDVPIDEVEVSTFEPPKRPPKPKTVNILYEKQVDLVKKVKKSLGVRSAKRAGELTFDYYVEQEGIEDD